ncbi:autotransporter assembly complex protein TamA [Sneathiella litorea]|uniref:BamA/TamA family outer membrane protein n=1 Tax=Sneathiella litorea TaxID=2606216 RepID=A0A6L8WB14_9PROT|nr:autotransporter assembly complex family protein [Sneathiella litorea]MZR32205.1 BamA/TamA family outer membrane protein [Sneathiella litorea]
MPLNHLKNICLLIILMIALPMAAANPLRAAEAAEASPAELDLDYDVNIKGAPTDALLDLLEQSSRLTQLSDKLPPSFAALRRRAETDVEGFEKVLRSEGYYGNEVKLRIDNKQQPIEINFDITPGPLFRITKFEILYTQEEDTPSVPELSSLNIEIGMPARAEPVINAQTQIIVDLANRGFPDATVAKQDAIVDFATDAMEVTLTIDAGPRLYMGELGLEGLETVETDYIRRLAQWQPGKLYDNRVLDNLRRRYLRTGLFDSVRLKSRDKKQPGSTVPITLVFVERDRRSIGLGASFSTSEGFGTQYYWENRNFFGEGETLRADLTVAEIRRELKVTFVKPNFMKIDQNFNANVDIRNETTDAYDEDAISVFVGLDRRWRKKWVVGAGVTAEYSEIDESGVTENFALGGLPLTARYDSTDDLLDPTKGRRFAASLVPYIGLNDNTPDFIRFEMDGSTYYSVLDEDRLVLAARGKLGLMAGDSAGAIPASKRFYAGGGGSVRGYEYQTVGPLDASNDPVGGRSLLEVGFEARTRITDSIGLVPFIEGGNVFESMAPDFSGEFLWGAGLGFRYYTAIGPIRFDVAVPLNPRKNVDDSYQFYISIGQAF